MTNKELREQFEQQGKTYFTVEYGKGTQNTTLEPSCDEFKVFESYEEAEKEFNKLIHTASFYLAKNQYVSIEKWSSENDYFAETVKIWYSWIANYYKVDKGFVFADGVHSSYEINFDKHIDLESAKKEFEYVKANLEKTNEYVALVYYEDDEYSRIIEIYYNDQKTQEGKNG